MKICPSCKGVCADSDSQCPHCGGPLGGADLTDADALVGLRLGSKYELTQFLGEGAMGWVYRGRHTVLESSVAVKILKPQLRPDEQRSERFKREARAASRLNHPHIISVIDFGETSSGLLYIVTEYLRGKPLSAVLTESGPMPIRRAFRLLSQILSALEESHNQGVIHRDLKPDNVMVSTLRGGEDFAKVLDFGIAKLADMDSAAKLTQAGQLFGTPDYMAPEQIRSQEVDGRADLYSAGVILFELLTGRLPFQADNLFDVLKDHLYTEPPSLSEAAPDISFSPEVELVVSKALAKDPEDRFASARDFQRGLRRAVRLATGKVQRCPACQALVRKEAKFCPECGYRLSPTETAKKKQRPRRQTVGTADTQLGVPTTKQTGPVSVSASHPTIDRLWAGGEIRFPLVGRGAERAALHALAEGRQSIVQITGDLGMGKTALAKLGQGIAEEQGLTVISVGPHPTLLPLPWHPIRSAVAQVLGLDAARIDAPAIESALAQRSDIQACEAGLLALFGQSGPLDRVDPSNRMAEMRACALDALCKAEPRLLIFEDLDLYDIPSLETVQQLVRRAVDGNIRILLTSAVPLVDGQHVQHLPLGPLDTTTIGQLITQLQGKHSGSWMHMVAHLVERAQGNPMWLEQAIALLAESGTESSQGLTDIVATRLSRLPASALQVVQLLAVIGMEAEEGQLLAGQDKETSPKAILDLLEHRGIVSRQQTGEKVRVRFHHPLLLQVVRETTPLDARQNMNRAVYERLAPAAHPMVLAHHLLEGALYEQAVDVLEAAGDAAMADFDAKGALGLYRHAADTLRWKLLEDEESSTNIRLNLKLAEAMEATGDLNGANVVLRYVEGLASANTLVRAQARLRLSRILAGLQRPVKAIKVVREAISDGILAGEADLLTEAYMFLANLLVHTGQIAEAAAELDEGLAMVTAGTQDGPPPASLWKLMAKAALLAARMDPGKRRAVDLAKQALELARAVGNHTAEARCELLLGHTLGGAGDQAASEEHYRKALDVVKSAGDRLGQATVLFYRARHGANGGAEQIRQQALSLAQEVGWQDSLLPDDRLSSATLDIIQ